MTTNLDSGSNSPSTSIINNFLELAVSPTGHFYLEALPNESDISSASSTSPITHRIRKAFNKSSAHGLLHLGAVELTTALSPSLAFGRELAHLFMTRLCAVPALEEQWATVELPVPRTELAQLAVGIPPFTGAEYLTGERLAALWEELLNAAREEIAAEHGDVQRWLQRKHTSWNLVGRVCFHLAENKADEHAPFAFLATYASGISQISRISQQARVQHLPLGRALKEYADAGDNHSLLKLLMPVNKAAEQCAWLKTLVDSRQIFHPLAWTPQEAYQLLQNIPTFEASGIVVRIPDWWKPRQPPRPQVQVKLGNHSAGMGLVPRLTEFEGFKLSNCLRPLGVFL